LDEERLSDVVDRDHETGSQEQFCKETMCKRIQAVSVDNLGPESHQYRDRLCEKGDLS
jgi:hypothetical protein